MLNFITGGIAMANSQRRQFKAIVTMLVLHFLVLASVQTAIQFGMRAWLNPVNSAFGILWEVGAILMIWIAGGLPLDAMLGGFLVTDVEFFEAIVRVLIGFFTVEAFLNVCFTLLPFYASAGGFGLIAVAAGCYFLFRFMARQTIDWSRWVWFPATCIGIGALICIVVALKPLFS